jgi:hypothetical protein
VALKTYTGTEYSTNDFDRGCKQRFVLKMEKEPESIQRRAIGNGA